MAQRTKYMQGTDKGEKVNHLKLGMFNQKKYRLRRVIY